MQSVTQKMLDVLGLVAQGVKICVDTTLSSSATRILIRPLSEECPGRARRDVARRHEVPDLSCDRDRIRLPIPRPQLE